MLEWVSSEQNNINREQASLFNTHTHSLGRMSEREVAGTREILLLLGDHLYVFRF